MGSFGKLGVLAVIVFAIVFSLVGEVAAASWIQTYNGDTNSSPLNSAVLTADLFDTYTIAKTGGNVDMSAPGTNTGNNLRKVFWSTDSPSVTDSQSCATWSSESAVTVQEGLALRISPSLTGTKAITVTKNVFGGTNGVFNVHVWDTNVPAQPYVVVGQLYMNHIVAPGGNLVAMPWNVCARVVGQILELKVWLPPNAEPAWGDPTYTAATTIPLPWVYPGKNGWYIGHIPPSGTARFNNLTTAKLVP